MAGRQSSIFFSFTVFSHSSRKGVDVDQQVKAGLVERLQNTLPDVTERIEACLCEHESFQDMCENYEECALGLERWRAAPERHGERIEEYSQLMRDLEDEILQYLKGRK